MRARWSTRGSSGCPHAGERHIPASEHRILEQIVYGRAGWTCESCGGPLNPLAPHGADDAPSLGHERAVSRDGSWSLSNLLAEQVGCNRAHGAERPPTKAVRA